MGENDVFINAVKKFHDNCKENNNHLQWEHCYKVFYETRNTYLKLDIDYLALHLAFYLASWGMYRGSTFLKDYDYRVHIPVVQEIFKKEYDILLEIDCDKYGDYEINILMKLQKELKAIYIPNTGKESSKILVTKILLGTLGCVPAYDTYFESEIKKHGFKNYSCNEKSIEELKKFYADNKEDFEKQRKNMKIQGTEIVYPQMKFIDMGFWQMADNAVRAEKST